MATAAGAGRLGRPRPAPGDVGVVRGCPGPRGPCRAGHRHGTKHAWMSFCLPHSENDKRRPSVMSKARSRRTARDLERKAGRASSGGSVRSVPSRDTRMRSAPTQKSAIASAETTHLLPPPTAVDPINNRDEANRRRARRCLKPASMSGRLSGPRASMSSSHSFAAAQRIGHFWRPYVGSGWLSAQSARVRARLRCPLRSATSRWWTLVITCHLRRPPVASALAAGRGIRRGLHAAAPTPAHAFGRHRTS